MVSLEEILEITAEINIQKKSVKKLFFGMVKNPLEKNENLPNLSSRVAEEIKKKHNSLPELSALLAERVGKLTYHPIKFFEKYIPVLKKILYNYYSAAKDAIKSAAKAFNVGYTDKTIIEVEDWGYIHFSTAFRNLNRITLLGAVMYYLETIYVCVTKKIKF